MEHVCTTGDHTRHLCQLVAWEVPLIEIKPLVRDPKFICKNCARAAADRNRLCDPDRLSSEVER